MVDFVYLVMTEYPDWIDDYPFERIAGVYLSENDASVSAEKLTEAAQKSRDAFDAWRDCTNEKVPPLGSMPTMKWQAEVIEKCGENPGRDEAYLYKVVRVPIGVIGSWN